MTLDLDAIARRQRCEISALRVALPLLEQGYDPPFLTRYRRDEIGPVSERALWEVVSALRTEKQLEARREELRRKYTEGGIDDDALLNSISEATTPRQLDRIARRIRTESGHSPPASRLAVRLLNPKQGDPTDLQQLSELVVGAEQAQAAVEGLHAVLGPALAADSRVLQAATEWMDKQVQLHIIEVHDPHEGSAHADSAAADDAGAATPSSAQHKDTGKNDTGKNDTGKNDTGRKSEPKPVESAAGEGTEAKSTTDDASPGADATSPVDAATEAAPSTETIQNTLTTPDSEAPSESAGASGDTAGPASSTSPDAVTATATEPEPEAAPAADAPAADGPAQSTATDAPSADSNAEQTASPTATGTEENAAADPSTAPEAQAADTQTADQSSTGPDQKSNAGKAAGGKSKPKETRKKISPRQRRRKWLVSVLQPLKGKSLSKAKLTAFQVVMIGRALRSQVVQCAFKYNAGEFVRHLAKVAGGLNEQASSLLSDVVIDNEAAIRESLEAAWWDDLIDRAARRLISVATESLRRQMLRDPIEAKTILSIDAIGPRTAAVAVVGVDGRVLHTEDVACQLTKAVRQQLVTRLGELVHQYHVDLIVLSNGPARRSCLVALTELLSQSEGTGLRWTLADRAGAEVYAAGPEGNRELRSVPRRFRAAVWLSQSVRTPARAMAKVDVGRLRLGSYQRELNEPQLAAALEDVVTSGVCQVSVDVNAADRGWLASLPGVSKSIAETIDRTRRESLFASRGQLLGLAGWPDLVAQRQAVGFLRVFGGELPLDATAIHPDDYPLAEKLIERLKIPMPPASPPGYETPDYSVEAKPSLAPDPTEGKPEFEEVKIAAVDESKPFGVSGEASSDAGTAEAEATAPADTTQSDTAAESPTAEAASADESSVSAAETDSELAAGEGAPEEAGAAAEGTEHAQETTEVSEETADSSEAVTEGEPAAAEATESDSDSEVTASDAAADGAETAGASVDASSVAESIEPYSQPLPSTEDVSRVVKEWQVGEHRVRHIVRALCQPFHDAGFDHHTPSATMTSVPKLADLKNTQDLELSATGDITLNNKATATEAEVILDAGGALTLGDDVSATMGSVTAKGASVSASGALSASGGNVSVNSGGTTVLDGKISATTGNVQVTSGSTLTTGDDIDATGGAVTIDATGSANLGGAVRATGGAVDVTSTVNIELGDEVSSDGFAVNVTGGGDVAVNGDVSTGGAADLTIKTTGGAVTMGDGTTASTSTGKITVEATGDVVLSGLKSTSRNVVVTAGKDPGTTGTITNGRVVSEGFNVETTGLATLTAKTGIGAPGNEQIFTKVSQLQAYTLVSGDIWIYQIGNLVIPVNSIEVLGGNGSANLTVEGDLETQGVIETKGRGDVNVNATGGVMQQNTGTIKSGGGDVNVSGSSVMQEGAFQTSGFGDVNVNATGGSVQMGSGASAKTDIGSVNYTGTQDVGVSQISTVGQVNVTAQNGSITGTGSTGSSQPNISASTLNLNAGKDIGTAGTGTSRRCGSTPTSG